MKEKLFYPLLGIIIFLALLLLSRNLATDNIIVNKTSSPSRQETTDQTKSNKTKETLEGSLVKKVIDGDTIELEDGQRIRYIGIDTPETVDPRKTVQCYGREASSRNKELVEGKRVRLEKDVSETDRYSRLLRYVYVGEVFVNEHLVKEGFARVSSYPPDVKFQEKFKEAENFARKNNKGLWGSCNLSGGQIQSSTNYSLTTLNSNAGCKIKGNISSSGEKIYHLSGGAYYDKTVIDESKGERWFCTEDEAVAAGWRKSKL